MIWQFCKWSIPNKVDRNSGITQDNRKIFCKFGPSADGRISGYESLNMSASSAASGLIYLWDSWVGIVKSVCVAGAQSPCEHSHSLTTAWQCLRQSVKHRRDLCAAFCTDDTHYTCQAFTLTTCRVFSMILLQNFMTFRERQTIQMTFPGRFCKPAQGAETA